MNIEIENRRMVLSEATSYNIEEILKMYKHYGLSEKQKKQLEGILKSLEEGRKQMKKKGLIKSLIKKWHLFLLKKRNGLLLIVDITCK